MLFSLVLSSRTIHQYFQIYDEGWRTLQLIYLLFFQSKPIRATPTTTTSGPRRISHPSKKDIDSSDSDEEDTKVNNVRSRQARAKNGKEVKCLDTQKTIVS